ncbi:MAG: hypothetical protein LBD87_06995, partial [Prevotellaceae bacterium]|nr:hypothetical protein [Prevotellaceae bacterium]
MKKIFFFFVMLASVAASAQVTNVEPVSANYATKTVSFRVWWNAGSRDATHLSKVWVWIDYITVNSDNTTSGNTWTRATVGTVSPATGVSYDGSNRNGFWLQGDESSNYSATLTVPLTNTSAKFNWCAYVSDYPPNVAYNNVTYDGGTYTFKGTPPFKLMSADGLQIQEFNETSITVAEIGFVPKNFTDATGCPGIGFCPYTGNDEFMDANHFCQLRTSGAKNWEAWIKDERDNKLYKIIYMPDNKWWWAQNLDYRKNLVMNADVNLPSNIVGSGVFAIGTYWCYDNSMVNCDTYGALYAFNTAMMVDGRCSSEDAVTHQGSGTCAIGTGWVEPLNSYCTGSSSADANCAKNVGRGVIIASGGGRGICPIGWHVPTDLEWGIMLDSAESSSSILHTTCIAYSCGID